MVESQNRIFSISSHERNTEVYVIIPLHALPVQDYRISYLIKDNFSGKGFSLVKYVKVQNDR
jgi:hypothetical protein